MEPMRGMITMFIGPSSSPQAIWALWESRDLSIFENRETHADAPSLCSQRAGELFALAPSTGRHRPRLRWFDLRPTRKSGSRRSSTSRRWKLDQRLRPRPWELRTFYWQNFWAARDALLLARNLHYDSIILQMDARLVFGLS